MARPKRRIVVALGGNALLKRGEAMTAENQRRNARTAAEALAPLCSEYATIITHGNGPQVGLLALQEVLNPEGEDYPLDVLVSETMGMIGYLIEQELGNLLPLEHHIATLLTMVEIDPGDPALRDPAKFIGKVYTEGEAKEAAAANGWMMKRDGAYWRRVVPSPRPKRIFQTQAIEWLLEKGVTIIAAGGGGIPTMYAKGEQHTLVGVEAVIDKDLASCLLAKVVGADCLVIATDTDAVYLDWGTPTQRGIRSIAPDALDKYEFPAGSMGPKVEAAQDFARTTGKSAIICALTDIPAAMKGERGTTVNRRAGETTFHQGPAVQR